MAYDERVVYGMGCTWWDSIDKIGRRVARDITFKVPCCPHCFGMLFEVDNEATWWSQVDAYEANGNPGYRDFILWLRGRCFPTLNAAREAYAARS